MRAKKTPREFHKENLNLLQAKREKDTRNDLFGVTCRRLCFVFILVILVGITIYLGVSTKSLSHNVKEGKESARKEAVKMKKNITAVIVPTPKVPAKIRIEGEQVDIGGVQFIWQNVPESATLKGLIFLAHGCKHVPSEWFLSSSVCPECNGLPMEVSIAHYFSHRGYALVALRPYHNSAKSQCWHPNDKENVTNAINYVYEKLGSTQLTTPVFAIGVANGGIFLGNGIESLQITHKIKFTATAMLNCGIWHSNYKVNKYSPVLFVDTSRNSELCDYNNVTMHKMLGKGIPSAQIAGEPLSLYPEFFHDGTALKLLGHTAAAKSDKSYTVSLVNPNVISLEDSRKLFAAYQKAGFLWPANNILLKDPNIERFIQEYKEVIERL